ncbi:hypothetical protein GCK32_012756, partial [Trichostrongylus colubriformis]
MSSDILEKVASNNEAAQELLGNASAILAKLRAMECHFRTGQSHRDSSAWKESPTVPLAPVPIPKFDGKLWKWETFWGAFNHSVHTRDMDDLQKMNYLIDALRGEARECVKQYEVSRHTYPVVIAYLQKYGDQQALVDELLRRLQNTRASSDGLRDQGNLCERLTSLVNQLRLKREQVDNVFLQKQLLRKFSTDVQRHILRQQQHQTPHTKWDTNDLLMAAKDYIRDEAKILHGTETPQFERTTGSEVAKLKQAGRSLKNLKDPSPALCFYCNKGGHPPKQCKEVPSREKRIEVLKKKNLCWNCGEQGHLSSQCARGNCRICNTFGHHTFICRKAEFASTQMSTAADTSSSKDAVSDFRVRLKRNIAKTDEPATLVLFSGASAQAMATCAYLVQKGSCNLIAGKCKLPRLKEKPTIPKMELHALTMATRLGHSIFHAIQSKLRINTIYIFTDSEIALKWIVKSDAAAGVLVNNRCKEVRQIIQQTPVPVRFGHVPTSVNPTDCATRGLTEEELTRRFWWDGPDFLKLTPDKWETVARPFPTPEEELNNENCFMNLSTSEKAPVSDLLEWKRHSSWRSCQTTMVYVLRFIKAMTSRVSLELQSRIAAHAPDIMKMSGEPYVTATERKIAQQILLRNHQQVHLPESRQHALKQLKLQHDSDGIIRCRGRLDKTNRSYDARQPILIATKSELARLLVRESHLPLHCGVAHTMANRDMVITYPLEYAGQDKDDPDYLPPEEIVRLQTRREAEQALQFSHAFTEKFWQIWSREY